MLKITTRDAPDGFRLELEGKLAGAWVPELESCWRSATALHGARGLRVDLTGVHCVDAAGRYLLALMHNAGARFVASGCAMSALVREITGEWPAQSRFEGGTDKS